MSDYDVAIVGYGPTGMVLAALLGARGHKVLVLERYTGLYNLPRAACFDDEVMRTFQKLGLAEEIGRGAVVQRDYDWVNAAGETLVDITYADPAPGGWAALYMMFQPHIEAVLDRFDRSLHGVEIRQGVTVAGLDQDDNGVVLRGTDRNGDAVCVRARFAVGADGGNGFMRQALATAVEDFGFHENWLVCDFRMRRSVAALPTFRQICDPEQPTSIVKLGPDHHRFSFMLNAGETAEEATRPERVWARVGPYLGRDDAELIRAVNYVFRSRITGSWRRGRAFLAGDAAHEMPPFLGQGMCSGIRDSHNLAWKLDLVLAGHASLSILDTYQMEREPQVRFITEKAIELGRVQTLRDRDEARRRDDRLLALRQSQKIPEQLHYPGLSCGLIGDGGGAFFPQGNVRARGREARFDDIIGPGWCIVAPAAHTIGMLPRSLRDAWEERGGRIALIGEDQGENALVDLDGVYSRWFADHCCAAAVVRPDWYLYAKARDAEALASALHGLAQSLDGRAALVAA